MSEYHSRSISPLALAVLALVHERPRHPYDIAYEMRSRHLESTIKLNFGSLYHTVEALQKAGWIEPLETSREGRRPERTVYTLTELGREAFVERLRELVAIPAREYSAFEAGLSFIARLEREEAIRVFNERCRQLDIEIAMHRQMLQTLLDGGLARLWVIEQEHALAMKEAELQWVQKVVAQVESGELEWKRVTEETVREHEAAGARRQPLARTGDGRS